MYYKLFKIAIYILVMITIGFSQNSFTVKHFELHKSVSAITFDKDGNIWYCTDGNGIEKHQVVSDSIIPVPEISYTTSDGLSDNNISQIQIDNNNSIWLGTTWGVSKISNNQITSYTHENGIIGGQVYSLTLNMNNIAYAVVAMNGISSFNGVDFTRDERLVSYLCYDLCFDKQDNKWIGASEKLIKILPNDSMVIYNSSDLGFSGLMAYMGVTCDRENNIWISTTTSGILKLAPDGNTKLFNKLNNGFTSDRFNDCFIDSKNRVYARYRIGINHGLAIINNNNVTNVGAYNNMLAGNSVYAVTEDLNGNIWIGTDGGISRIQFDETGLMHKSHGKTKDLKIQKGNNILKIFSSNAIHNLSIYSFSGKLLFSKVGTKETHMEINTECFSKGSYILKISDSNSINIKKFKIN